MHFAFDNVGEFLDKIVYGVETIDQQHLLMFHDGMPLYDNGSQIIGKSCRDLLTFASPTIPRTATATLPSKNCPIRIDS